MGTWAKPGPLAKLGHLRKIVVDEAMPARDLPPAKSCFVCRGSRRLMRLNATMMVVW